MASPFSAKSRGKREKGVAKCWVCLVTERPGDERFRCAGKQKGTDDGTLANFVALGLHVRYGVLKRTADPGWIVEGCSFSDFNKLLCAQCREGPSSVAHREHVQRVLCKWTALHRDRDPELVELASSQVDDGTLDALD